MSRRGEKIVDAVNTQAPIGKVLHGALVAAIHATENAKEPILFDPNLPPEPGIYIARVNYGEQLGELIILKLRLGNQLRVDLFGHPDAALIEPPRSAKIYLEGNDDGGDDRHSWKLERKIDLVDVLTGKRDPDTYTENCLRSIARLVDFPLNEDNPEWPEAVEAAVGAAILQQQGPKITKEDQLLAFDVLVEARERDSIMNAAVVTYTSPRIDDPQFDLKAAMQLALRALRINQALVAKNILELALEVASKE